MAAPNKPSLDTLDEIFRFAVRRFRSARLASGHGTTNARAEAALRKALELFPKDVRAKVSLAVVLCDRHEFAEALEVAREVGRAPSFAAER